MDTSAIGWQRRNSVFWQKKPGLIRPSGKYDQRHMGTKEENIKVRFVAKYKFPFRVSAKAEPPGRSPGPLAATRTQIER